MDYQNFDIPKEIPDINPKTKSKEIQQQIESTPDQIGKISQELFNSKQEFQKNKILINKESKSINNLGNASINLNELAEKVQEIALDFYENDEKLNEEEVVDSLTLAANFGNQQAKSILKVNEFIKDETLTDVDLHTLAHSFINEEPSLALKLFQKAAEKGNPEAILLISLCGYSKTNGKNNQRDEYNDFLKDETLSDDDLYVLGYSLKNEYPDLAIKLLKKAAKKGNLDAVSFLSQNDDNKALKIKLSENYKLISKANTNALEGYNLAQSYQKLKDLKKARLFFELGSKAFDSQTNIFSSYCNYEIGMMLSDEKNEIFDKTEATKYFKLTINNSKIDPITLNNSVNKIIELIFKKNELVDEEDVKFLEQHANGGNIQAQAFFIAYHRSKGNLVEASYWENLYKKNEFDRIAPMIDKIDGTLLCIANNSSQINEIDLTYREGSREKLLTKQTKVMIDLKTRGMISPDEDLPIDRGKVKGGVCTGMVFEFFARLLETSSKGNAESQLLPIARPFECRSGTSAVASQVIYSHLHAKAFGSILKKHVFSHIKEPGLFTLKELQIITRIETNLEAQEALYGIRGIKNTPMPELGIPGSFSDSDYLNHWFDHTTPESNYVVGIKTMETGGYHTIALLKRAEQVYLWDPNIGLVKCSSENPVKFISQYLSTNYPETANHEIDISRIDPILQQNV